MRDSLAYLARSERGLGIEDLRDPTNPGALATVRLAARGIALSDRYAFSAASGMSGCSTSATRSARRSSPRAT
ncbi:MAG: hypothetical protein Q8S73_42285 [Deltaproteobacteria bacterium]|nr:hypothetical protein [Myxococcales bacterium]MDP3220790.1 hypothetical protein [Deltaproteobacteria bacterium]